MCVPQGLIALQALSAVQQAVKQRESNKQQEAALLQQAALNRQQAEEERRRGILESNKDKVETVNLQAQQRNALAAAGVNAAEGTSIDILADTQTLKEQDRKESLRVSQRRADGLDQNALNAEQERSFRKSQSDSDFLSKGSTLLTRRFSDFSKRGLLSY